MSGAATFSWTLPPGPPLTEEQRARVVEAYPLAGSVVRRLAARNPLAYQHADELHGVASEGIIWAAQKYDPQRGSVWMSYAYGGAFIRCRLWLRAMKLRETRELDHVLATNDDGDELTRMDVTPDLAPAADELLFRRQARALVERLPERERAAVRRYLEDLTLEDVARAHGYTRESVRRWELSGLQRLRAGMGLAQHPGGRAAPLFKWRERVHARERIQALLQDGTPRTAAALAKLVGCSQQAAGVWLRRLGAVQVGTIADGRARAALWTIPSKAS